mmetsp:Transcript_19984/g.60403  ORF Transcript_19984/g.60403 Transcript_19984/m.60403 type:complete len:317 (-) Transcript_19984:522-1472(-)
MTASMAALHPGVLPSGQVSCFGRARVSRGAAMRTPAVKRDIRLIATDVDGTLLNNKQELTPRVQGAITAAVELGVPVVVATGKPRGPWAKTILPKLGPAVPGVFMQGLVIADGKGNTIFSRELDREVGVEGLQIARQHGLTFAAYCGDRILSEVIDKWTDVLVWYGEPHPEKTEALLEVLSSGSIPMQKFILLGEQELVESIRPLIQQQLGDRASLTTALPGMLEVLPLGASKGAGLARLLGQLGVDPQHVLAMGDGENDVEMFNLVGTSVAMGNAVQQLKDAADVVLEETHNQDAVAVAIEKYVLAPRGAMADLT